MKLYNTEYMHSWVESLQSGILSVDTEKLSRAWLRQRHSLIGPQHQHAKASAFSTHWHHHSTSNKDATEKEIKQRTEQRGGRQQRLEKDQSISLPGPQHTAGVFCEESCSKHILILLFLNWGWAGLFWSISNANVKTCIFFFLDLHVKFWQVTFLDEH